MNPATECLGYAVNNLAGTITEISTAYAAALGYRVSDLLGRNFRDVIAPEIMAAAEVRFAEVVERGSGHLRAVYVQPCGDRIAMDVSLLPIRTDDGRLASVLIVPQAGTMMSRLKRGSVVRAPRR